MVFLATAVVIVYIIVLSVNVQAPVIKYLHMFLSFRVSQSFQNYGIPSMCHKCCVTVYIEDELRVTRTQRVDITLSSDDDRIALQQTTADMEINRIPVCVIF